MYSRLHICVSWAWCLAPWGGGPDSDRVGKFRVRNKNGPLLKWLTFLSSSLLGLQAQTPTKNRKKSIKQLAGSDSEHLGAESRVYNVAGNGYIGEMLERSSPGPEASRFL